MFHVPEEGAEALCRDGNSSRCLLISLSDMPASLVNLNAIEVKREGYLTDPSRGLLNVVAGLVGTWVGAGGGQVDW